jgi:hypothetical protein
MKNSLLIVCTLLLALCTEAQKKQSPKELLPILTGRNCNLTVVDSGVALPTDVFLGQVQAGRRYIHTACDSCAVKDSFFIYVFPLRQMEKAVYDFLSPETANDVPLHYQISLYRNNLFCIMVFDGGTLLPAEKQELLTQCLGGEKMYFELVAEPDTPDAPVKEKEAVPAKKKARNFKKDKP